MKTINEAIEELELLKNAKAIKATDFSYYEESLKMGLEALKDKKEETSYSDLRKKILGVKNFIGDKDIVLYAIKEFKESAVNKIEDASGKSIRYSLFNPNSAKEYLNVVLQDTTATVYIMPALRPYEQQSYDLTNPKMKIRLKVPNSLESMDFKSFDWKKELICDDTVTHCYYAIFSNSNSFKYNVSEWLFKELRNTFSYSSSSMSQAKTILKNVDYNICDLNAMLNLSETDESYLLIEFVCRAISVLKRDETIDGKEWSTFLKKNYSFLKAIAPHNLNDLFNACYYPAQELYTTLLALQVLKEKLEAKQR